MIEFPRTIFSIGGRGYYENPTSDLLKFFLHPQEVHGLGTLFLDALSACLGLAGSHRPTGNETLAIYREEEAIGTDGRCGRIDLLIRWEKRIWVIENKHWHDAQNPFELYKEHVLQKYPKSEPTFILLAFNATEVSEPWRLVMYSEYIAQIRGLMGNQEQLRTPPSDTDRWKVLTNEAIKHLQLEAHAFEECDIQKIYKILDRKDVPRDFEAARAALSHVIERDLGVVKTEAWTPADNAKGWDQGYALAFRVIDASLGGIAIWFCIRYANATEVDVNRIVFVAWLRDEDQHHGIWDNWTLLKAPQAKHWEEAKAYKLDIVERSFKDSLLCFVRQIKSIRESISKERALD